MIPYFEQPSLKVGPLTLHAFGALVALAVVGGYLLAARRARAKSLDPAVMESLLSWVLGIGFIGAHLFAVVVYFPGELRAHPWMILRFWENLSSFGGVLGGALGAALFFRFRLRPVNAVSRRSYLDVLAFVLPFAWLFGRLACTFAHDHPGWVTSFPLAVSLRTEPARRYIIGVYKEAGLVSGLPRMPALAGMGFHDLGWYEFLYLIGVVVPTFLLLDRRARRPGFFVVWLVALYLPVRFGLDFLRVGDARYLGLTPGQYAAAAMGVFVIGYVLNRRRVHGFRAEPASSPVALVPQGRAGEVPEHGEDT